MADYRYLVFPAGMQPTAEEAAQLRGMADALSHRFAIGRDRGQGALVIAFDAEVFDRTMESHVGFERLVRRWQRLGCHVVDHLKFVKDATALQVEPGAGTAATLADLPSSEPSSARMVAFKELAAKEALGRSMLRVQQTLERHEALMRLGTWMPYLLMAVAALGTISIGLYIGVRLSGSDTEPRKVTTERMLEDSIHQLRAKPTDDTQEPAP